MPVARLTDKAYAARIREKINLAQATASEKVAPGMLLPEESPQTTHFTVADDEGNLVANTYTLNFSFGSGIAVPGAGFLLNNEMDDFAAKPGTANAYGLIGGDANAVEAGKRPLSSMTPTLIFKDGKAMLGTGSPGGSRIISAVFQVVLNTLDGGLNIAEATARPRIHHQWLPDEIKMESGISTDTVAALAEMGHTINERRRNSGSVQSIMIQDGAQLGVSDSRRSSGGVSTVDALTAAQ